MTAIRKRAPLFDGMRSYFVMTTDEIQRRQKKSLYLLRVIISGTNRDRKGENDFAASLSIAVPVNLDNIEHCLVRHRRKISLNGMAFDGLRIPNRPVVGIFHHRRQCLVVRSGLEYSFIGAHFIPLKLRPGNNTGLVACSSWNNIDPGTM